MKIKQAFILFMTVLAGNNCWSQATVADDFRPSTLNQPGQLYPQVNSQRYVRFRINAPLADSVRVSLGLGGEVASYLRRGMMDSLPVQQIVQWMKDFIIII